VPVVNLPGIKPGELVLSGRVLADIYLGKIISWNAPAIAAINPGLKLPDAPTR
jgi:phosphate transport system substrate-binding protein